MPVNMEKFWTLPEALLWIITRNPEQVSQVLPEERHNLRQVLRDTLTTPDDPFAVYSNPQVQNAIERLKTAAANDRIKTYGKKSDADTHVPIPAVQWHSLSLMGSKGNIRLQCMDQTAWTQPLIESADVIREWPGSGNAQTETASAKQKRRGRTKGSGVIPDDEELKYMDELLARKKARSIRHAATEAVSKFGFNKNKGSSEDRYIKRLQEKYPSWKKNSSV